MGLIPYGEFARLDIRIARVTHAEPMEGKARIMKGRVDLGDGDVRDVIIGGAQYYAPGDMIGRTVVVVANLEPKEVAGVTSGAMLLAADVDGRPYWLAPRDGDPDVPPGSPVK